MGNTFTDASAATAATGMLLSEARAIVRSTTKTDSTSNSDSDVDRAIKIAGDEFMRQTRFVRTTDDSLNLTINLAELDVSSVTGFRPERLYKAGVRHPRNANGLAWSSATISYQKNEITQQSNLFYVATSDHTSAAGNEPGTSGGTMWNRIHWDREYPLKHVNYNAVAHDLNYQAQWDNIPELDDSIINNSDRPCAIAFRDSDNAVVWPPPEDNWAVRLIYYETFTDWTIGTSDAITLNIPEEYIHGVLVWGASAVVVYRDWAQVQQSGSWLRFQEHITRVNGDAHTDGVATYAIPSNYT